MKIHNQIITLSLLLVITFVALRQFVGGIPCYLLNKSAYKKRKKRQTVWEWFCYSRFKKEIPKTLLFLYFFVIVVHSLSIIACVIFNLVDNMENTGTILTKVIFWFDVVWMAVIIVMFNRPTKKEWAYDRWITKKK